MTPTRARSFSNKIDQLARVVHTGACERCQGQQPLRQGMTLKVLYVGGLSHVCNVEEAFNLHDVAKTVLRAKPTHVVPFQYRIVIRCLYWHLLLA